MITETYMVQNCFLSQSLKQVDIFFFQLKLIRTDFLEHEILTRFPFKIYTEVSSQVWPNSVEYLHKHSRITRVDDAHNSLMWARKHEKDLLRGLGTVFHGSLIMWIIIQMRSAILKDQEKISEDFKYLSWTTAYICSLAIWLHYFFRFHYSISLHLPSAVISPTLPLTFPWFPSF